MAYFLCDVYVTSKNKWLSDFSLFMTLFLKVYRYDFSEYTTMQGDNVISTKYSYIGKFRICDVDTFEIKDIGFEELHKLYDKGELIGVEDCNEDEEDLVSNYIRCISKNGYIVSTMLDTISYSPKKIGENIKGLVPDSESIYSIYTSVNEEIPLFYTLLKYNPFDGFILDMSIYVGEYIVYAIMSSYNELFSRVINIEDDVLTLWGIYDFKKQGKLVFKILDVDRFMLFISKLKLLEFVK